MPTRKLNLFGAIYDGEKRVAKLCTEIGANLATELSDYGG